MRKSKPKKRMLLPDPKFNDPFVTRFVNNLMFNGKKNLAYQIFYDSLDIVGDKFKEEGKSPLEIFKQALENVNSRKKGNPLSRSLNRLLKMSHLR